MRRGISKVIFRFAVIFCASIVLFAFSPVPVFADPAFDAPGDGSSSHPYLVTTCQQLQDMNNILSAHYKLMRNIDCSNFGNFNMIGNSFASTPFTGVLDGNHYSIVGLKSNLGGMFGYTNGATIKDLQIIDSNFTIATTIYAGTLIDVATGGTLTNVHSSITMGGSAPQVGGLIGNANNTVINNSSFTGTISVSDAEIIGGLVALGDAVITDSYSRATLAATRVIGGLVGEASDSTSVTRSYSASTLGHADLYAGGLMGEVASFSPITLTDSFSASTLNGANQDVGGVVGEVDFSDPTGTTYYDDTLAGGINVCMGSGTVNCVPVNISNAAPNYFKNNSTNPPLNGWDFTSGGPWVTRTGDYPELRVKSSFHTNSFVDMNGDSINDLTQGTVNSASDGVGGEATFVIDQTAHCINDNSGSFETAPNFTTPDDPKYHIQTTSYWETDIYCRDAGTNIPVTMILDGVYDTSNSVLRHFNPTTHIYSTISGATFHTVTINGTPKTAVSYSISEGGSLDPDGTANGFILDPVALVQIPASGTASNTIIPGVPNTGLGQPLMQTSSRSATTQGRSITSLIIAIVSFSAAGVLGYVLRRLKKQY